jgi:hypothetical protein
MLSTGVSPRYRFDAAELFRPAPIRRHAEGDLVVLLIKRSIGNSTDG